MTDCQSCGHRKGAIEWRGVRWCDSCFEAEAEDRVDDREWIRRVLGTFDDAEFDAPLNAVGVGLENRAGYLERNTVLSPRRAEIQALRERGLGRNQMAEQLDLSVNTIDEHRQEIEQTIERAKTTVNELAD